MIDIKHYYFIYLALILWHINRAPWWTHGEKSDKHTKIPSWFANIKLFAITHFSNRQEEIDRLGKLSRPRQLDEEKQNVFEFFVWLDLGKV